jgi:hypothetical protein
VVESPPDQEHLRKTIHELANTLAVVVGNIGFLDDEVVLGEPARAVVEDLKEAAARFPEILKQLRRHI